MFAMSVGGSSNLVFCLKDHRSVRVYGFIRRGHMDLQFGYARLWFQFGQVVGAGKVSIRCMYSGMHELSLHREVVGQGALCG